MKKANLFLLILIGSILGCDKSSVFKEMGPVYGPIYNASPYSSGYLIGKKNGREFKGDTDYINHEIYCTGCFSLKVLTFEDSVDLKEFLVVSNLNSAKLGMYTLFPDDPSNNTLGNGIGLDKNSEVRYSTYLEIGDVDGDTYELYTSHNGEPLPNWLEIISVDTLNKVITGKFELHFIKTIENDLLNTKYVRFSEVEFEVNIE